MVGRFEESARPSSGSAERIFDAIQQALVILGDLAFGFSELAQQFPLLGGEPGGDGYLDGDVFVTLGMAA
ncbi:MAG: hypothetical protein GTO55_11150 [Armatimonadetes bacterium]|nr:hypothetical protein [Armatimonadota bacterium]NIM24775.1 hypothetical protein [Armatimonadota bacterium]NIM68664.1 hypothetical protein [Armatimonadota bacterium]NIN06867.1 hypothetical protein [Armatimonadota bacterium]NIO75705.1 hypothetical protein [Armatimonadota bacterium]